MQITSKLSFNKPSVQIPLAAKRQLFIAVTATILITILSIAYYMVAQPELPIFYSLPQTNQQLTAKIWLFIFPVMSLVINVLHTIMLTIMREFETILLRLFGTFTIVIQFLLLLALVRIIFITW